MRACFIAEVVFESTFLAFMFIMCERKSFNAWLKDFASKRLRSSSSPTLVRISVTVSDSSVHEASLALSEGLLSYLMRGKASECTVCMFFLASVTAPRTAFATPQDSDRRWIPSETSWNIVSSPLELFLAGDRAGEIPSLESPGRCTLLPEADLLPT